MKFPVYLLATAISVGAVCLQAASKTPPAKDTTSQFVIHSRDYPSGFWANLDATIVEIESNSTSSVLSVEEGAGTHGAGAMGRFFWCVAMYLTRLKGFKYYVASGFTNGSALVVYLSGANEDVEKMVDEKYENFALSKTVHPAYGKYEFLCAPLIEKAS